MDTLTVTHDDGTTDTLTTGEFIMHNMDDTDLCAKVRALCVGDSFVVGGGAAPIYVVQRIE